MAIDGTWNVSFSTPMGQREAKLELASDGGLLTGTWTGQQGSAPIEGGTVEGDSVAWKVPLQTPMGNITLVFEGAVSGDKLNGTVETPRGRNEFQGTRA